VDPVQAPTERNGLPHGGAKIWFLAALGNSRDSALSGLNLIRLSSASSPLVGRWVRYMLYEMYPKAQKGVTSRDES